MSHAYTPGAFPQYAPASGALTNPDDGDPLLAASVNVAFEPLADRSKLAYLGLYGVQGARVLASSAAPDTITIGTTPIIRSDTRVISGALAPFSAATVYGAALAANQIYYVYAADSGGVLVPIVTTDGPDSATLKYRIGNGDQAFVTFFCTDGAANVLHFTHYEGAYHWDVPITLLSGAFSAVFVAVPIPQVPYFARAALITQICINGDTVAPAQFNFRPTGAASTNHALFTAQAPGAGVPAYGQSDPEILIQDNAGFEYVGSNPIATISVFLRGIRL